MKYTVACVLCYKPTSLFSHVRLSLALPCLALTYPNIQAASKLVATNCVCVFVSCQSCPRVCVLVCVSSCVCLCHASVVLLVIVKLIRQIQAHPS